MKYRLNEWEIKSLAAWMDGGSTTLYFANKKNQELTIDIQQHVIEDYYEELSKIPGRLYLNDEIIERRSTLESEILKYLKETVVEKLKGLDRDILKDQIIWIESPQYIEMVPIKLTMSASRRREYESKIGIHKNAD